MESSRPELLEVGSEAAVSEKQPESDLLHEYDVADEVASDVLEVLESELRWLGSALKSSLSLMTSFDEVPPDSRASRVWHLSVRLLRVEVFDEGRGDGGPPRMN